MQHVFIQSPRVPATAEALDDQPSPNGLLPVLLCLPSSWFSSSGHLPQSELMRKEPPKLSIFIQKTTSTELHFSFECRVHHLISCPSFLNANPVPRISESSTPMAVIGVSNTTCSTDAKPWFRVPYFNPRRHTGGVKAAIFHKGQLAMCPNKPYTAGAKLIWPTTKRRQSSKPFLGSFMSLSVGKLTEITR